MKLEVLKYQGGLEPASTFDQDALSKLSNDEQYTIDVRVTRNPAFHRKVFAFFHFCFNHWNSENEYQSERKQFDVFRDHMTVLAGFYEKFYNIDGEVRIEAKSLSYGNMEQEEFEQCYSALINVALRKIFTDATPQTEQELYGFF